MFIVCCIFALLETVAYGVGSWTIMYLYIWPLLVFIVLMLKPIVRDCFLIWAVVSGTFGLCFGALCTLVYFPFGWAYMVVYFSSGFPWDILHSITNFIIMIALGNPLYKALRRVINETR